jgi:hypothetical protein
MDHAIENCAALRADFRWDGNLALTPVDISATFSGDKYGQFPENSRLLIELRCCRITSAFGSIGNSFEV